MANFTGRLAQRTFSHRKSRTKRCCTCAVVRAAGCRDARRQEWVSALRAHCGATCRVATQKSTWFMSSSGLMCIVKACFIAANGRISLNAPLVQITAILELLRLSEELNLVMEQMGFRLQFEKLLYSRIACISMVIL